jgi:hypothetical protein
VDYTFLAGDAGVHTFTLGAILVTAGNQVLAATDTVASTITGGTVVSVLPAAATHFGVSAPLSGTAGVAFSFTVTALDPYGNIATGYRGTVHFTKSDGGSGSAVPADSPSGPATPASTPSRAAPSWSPPPPRRSPPPTRLPRQSPAPATSSPSARPRRRT